MKNHEAQTDSVVKRNNLKILEKALEFKGILSSSEEYWSNFNINENKNNQLNSIEIKEKNKNNNSEMRCSITTNDSYCYTQNSEYDINQFSKEGILNSKNEEYLNSSKLRNSVLSSNKTEYNKETNEYELDVSCISKINKCEDCFNSKLEDKMPIKHHLLKENINFIKSNDRNNISFNNLEKNLEVLVNNKNNNNTNKKQNQIKDLNLNKSLDTQNTLRIKIIRNEKRKRKSKIKTEWTRMDDIKIIELVEIYNFDWAKIASLMNKPEELIKQRYEKRLDPRLKFTKFSLEEDNAIINLYKIYGSTWNYISKFFPNRTSIMIKNRFYSSLKKRIFMEKMVVADKDNNLKTEEMQVNELKTMNNINIQEGKGLKKQNSIITFKGNYVSIFKDQQESTYKCANREKKNITLSDAKTSANENNNLKSETNSLEIRNQSNNIPRINLSSIKISGTNQQIINERIELIKSKKGKLDNDNKQRLIINSDIEKCGNLRKNSLNEIMFNDLDSLSVKSSFNCFFEKIDIAKEKSLRESEEIKIFSNLNHQKNAFDFDENDNNAFEKITTNLENESYNYSSIINELLDNSNINFDSNKDFSFLDSEFLSEEDLIENINKINNQKLFIENNLKNFEKELLKKPDNKHYQEVKVNILKKIEFLVQVIRKLKSKIEKISK